MVVNLLYIMSAHLAGECSPPLDLMSHAFIIVCILFKSANVLQYHI